MICRWPIGAGWRRRRPASPGDVQRAAKLLFEQSSSVAVVVIDRPAIRTADEVVAAIGSMDPRDMIRAMFETAPSRLPRSSIVRWPATTPCCPRSRRRCRRTSERLGCRSSANRSRPSPICAGCWRRGLKHFTPIESRVAGILERDYDARAADRASLAPVDLIERTTTGIRWLPEGGVKRVILAPSYFSRPYNFLMSGSDFRFFGYPVLDEALETDRPTGGAAVGRPTPPGARG